MNSYGWLLQRGIGLNEDKKKACKLFKKVTDKGHLNAMLNYEFKSYSGIGTDVILLK